MKRICSAVLSMTMLLGTLLCFHTGVYADTRKNVPAIKVGDKFSITFSISKKNDYTSNPWNKSYFAKFTPEEDGLYEFAVDGLDFYGYGAYSAMITDRRDNVVAYAYSIGEESFSINLVGNLKKGKTYYYLVHYSADYDRTVKLKVHLKKHKHKMIDVTRQIPDAEYLINYAIDSEEPVWICKTQGCFFSGAEYYYHRYTLGLSKKAYTYDGKEKKPKFVFFDMRGKAFDPVEKGTVPEMKVVYKNNLDVGRAKAKIRIDDEWETVTFIINPKGTALGRLNGVRSGIRVRWKKQPVKTSGYQVQYAADKTFKKAKTVTVKGSKKTSVTVKKLRRFKAYYVRVRTYKTVDGRRYYSAWSKAKRVKTR